MTAVSLLIDNDIVIKLAQMDVYREGIESIGGKTGHVGSTEPMLRFLARATVTNSLRLTHDEQDRLRKILVTITEVEVTVEEGQLAAAMMKVILEAELDIQEGELLLMAIALKREGIRIATGDKRALRDLARLARAYPDLVRLTGRFICLEQIFKNICRLHGLARVRTAVVLARHADSTITKAYDVLSPGGASAFRQGLANEAATVAAAWLANI